MKFSCGLDVCLWCLIYVVNGLIMENFEDLFSLEDDDVSQIFITQEGKEPISELLDKSNDDVDADKNIIWGVRSLIFKCRPCLLCKREIYQSIQTFLMAISCQNLHRRRKLGKYVNY